MGMGMGMGWTLMPGHLYDTTHAWRILVAYLGAGGLWDGASAALAIDR